MTTFNVVGACDPRSIVARGFNFDNRDPSRSLGISENTKGTLARPLFLWLEERLLLFLAALFLTTLFLCCHVSILPFPLFMDVRF
jgi:hypothetical protein